jgi:hypothetical protein
MSNLLFENISHEDLKFYIQEYYNFANNLLNLKRKPKVTLKKDKQNSKDILGKTGYYNPETEEICLFITDRHGKDVLRSFAHELIHHDQKLNGFNDNLNISLTASDPSYMLHDEGLKEMERDAFERGNMMFRTWTDTMKMEKKNMFKKNKTTLNEASKPDFLDLDNDGNKKEPMKKAAKQAKKGKKEMKKEDMDRLHEIEDLDKLIKRSSAPHKGGMSMYRPDEEEEDKRQDLDTGEEASADDLKDLEIDDDEGVEEPEEMPVRGKRSKVDPYDSAMAFDIADKEREARRRAAARAEADDAPMMSDEELEALIAKRKAEREEIDAEIAAYIARLEASDVPEEMQESKKNPYPTLFESRERLLNEAFKTKEERVYNELIRRFIKK